MESKTEKAVAERYSQGAKAQEAALCCPVDYDPKWLEIIPKEIIEKDYGCGDPTPFVYEGDTVLDLGSGGGKICYMLSQKVGSGGTVIGVDMNDDMLALAQKYQAQMAEKIGYSNVRFIKSKIQDLTPVEENSIDVIVSNCVLNLVQENDKKVLFKEMYRVLKRGGRVAISDIVSDEPIPQRLKDDPTLWSGCLSGAFTEEGFLKAFEDAGFYGLEIAKRDETPWQVVEGIEFRSLTLCAKKGKEGECWDHLQAVVYKGPFRQICDDDDHIYRRGQRVAVCEKTFKLLKQAPYADNFYFIEPLATVPEGKARPFNCDRNATRSARETKGEDYQKTLSASECCSPSPDPAAKGGSCC